MNSELHRTGHRTEKELAQLEVLSAVIIKIII
jgi:hypothetical protein